MAALGRDHFPAVWCRVPADYARRPGQPSGQGCGISVEYRTENAWHRDFGETPAGGHGRHPAT